jgi:hypothetical protein
VLMVGFRRVEVKVAGSLRWKPMETMLVASGPNRFVSTCHNRMSSVLTRRLRVWARLVKFKGFPETATVPPRVLKVPSSKGTSWELVRTLVWEMSWARLKRVMSWMSTRVAWEVIAVRAALVMRRSDLFILSED